MAEEPSLADSRPYRGRADLGPLLAFASRSFAERSGLNATWHPGDFVWELRGAYDRPQPIRLWDSPSGVVAVAWFVGPALLWLEALCEAEALVPQIIDWAETKVRGEPDPGAAGLSIRAFESDAARIAVLEDLGYRRSAPESVWFRLDLAQPPPAFDPPLGFVVRDCVGIDPERRAAIHRDAWNDLSRIGLPDARSSFDAPLYQSLSAAPPYDPSLDMLVETPNGGLAASALCWGDTASGVGVFEPVGAAPAFRGLGLARLAILEACRRLRARGHRWARIGTAHFNAPAISAYGACGFEQHDRAHWWTKAGVQLAAARGSMLAIQKTHSVS
jgi:GNAT superfamily N-acetyltransferase